MLSGLIEGEEVVTSAQFMVDSESKLREATEKMMLQLQNKKSSNNKMPPMDMKNSVEMKVKEQ